jgi:hypothetical protein
MFADMPLDNRTVDQLAAIAARMASVCHPEHVTAKRNDLIFRPD